MPTNIVEYGTVFIIGTNVIIYKLDTRHTSIILRGPSDLVNSSIINSKSESNSEGLHTNRFLVTIKSVLDFLTLLLLLLLLSSVIVYHRSSLRCNTNWNCTDIIITVGSSVVYPFLSELSGPALLLRLKGCQVKYYYFNIIPNIMTDVLLLLLLWYVISKWDNISAGNCHSSTTSSVSKFFIKIVMQRQISTTQSSMDLNISLVYKRHYNGKRWIDQQAVLQRRGFLFSFSC